MDRLFSAYLHAGLLGTVIILVILLLRPLLKNAPRRIVCLLWLLAGLRLLLPFELVSDLSLQPRYNPDTVLTTVAPDIKPDDPAPTVVPAQKPEPLPQQKPEQTPDLPEAPADPIPESKPSATRPPETTAPVKDTPEPVDLTRLLPDLWALGTLVLLSYGAISYLALCYRVRTATKRDDGTMECERINSAFLLGYFRPRIYVPLLLDDRDRSFIIAHEETHLHRGDNWWKLLGMICLALHWYNPLVWVGYAMMCRDLEAACDERVVGSMDIEARKAYATALLNSCKRLSGVLMCPVAFGEVDLKQRIKRVLSYRKPGLLITALAFAAVVFVGCCFLTSPSEESAPTQSPDTTPTLTPATAPTQTAVTDPTESQTTEPTEPPAVIAEGEINNKYYLPIYWEITSDGTLTVTGTGESIDRETYPWMDYSDTVTTVIVADGITYVTQNMFRGMKKVSRVHLGNTVKGLGQYAFYDCIALRSVTIPASVENIEWSAFTLCKSLTEVNFAPGCRVTRIQEGAFSHSGITSFTAPPSLLTIGYDVFYSCTSLETVILAEGAETIEGDAFKGCTNLKKVVLGGSVKTINSPFMDCPALSEVTFTDSVTAIPSSAFMGCNGLTSVTIPDTVTSIGDQAFSNTGLQRLVIPASVTELGNGIVSDTPVEKIIFEGDYPTMHGHPLADITAIAYYPANNETWIEDELFDYWGEITWVPYTQKEEIQ